MPASLRSKLSFFPSLPFFLFALLLCVLFLCGGSSRPDAPGQIFVQTASVLVIIVTVLLGPRPSYADGKPLWLILSAAILIGFIQLIPLPPTIWQALPGRMPYSAAAVVVGEPQPWRPISLVPGATVNSIASLFAPLAVLLLVAQLKNAERRLIPGMILAIIAATTLIGLIQFSGLSLTTPVADNAAGDVSGFLANRNHFALLLAIGCIVAPTWAFSGDRRQEWRGPIALGFVLLFMLSILASGSRAGMIVGALGISMGFTIARRGVKRSVARYPRWVFPVVVSAAFVIIIGFTVASFAADRAISINRLLAADPTHDLRTRTFPIVKSMVATYFPVGSGLGSFYVVFQAHEPLDLLTTTYLNHAHNDILEIASDAGLAGIVLLFAALLWWSKATFQSWRAGPDMRNALSKAGAATIFLSVVASLVDYPARTPIIMAVLVVAGTWLIRVEDQRGPALPQSSRHL